MKTEISIVTSTIEILETVKLAADGDEIVCYSERHYSLLKLILIKLQRSDLSVEWQNARGDLIKRVRARKKDDHSLMGVEADPGLHPEQVKAVRALEDAFRLCYANRLSVVGFSDGLVAIPAELGLSLGVLSSTEAMDVDSMDVYQGFEPEDDEQ